MPYRLSNYHVVSDRIVAPGGAASRLVYATRTGRAARFPEKLYDSMKEGDFEGIPDATLMQLFDLELIVPSHENEFKVILEQNKSAVAANRNLSVTIQPTANCQLGCSYCGQAHRKKNVSKLYSDKIIDRIFSNIDTKGYKHLSVTWFGAEPLMAYSEIIRMSDLLIAGCNQRGIGYDAFMVTNGLSFKPSIFPKLSDRLCRDYQITLDGTAETHDSLRMTKSGLPTFDLIIRNIAAVSAMDEYRESGSSITVRMNVNKVSARQVPDLIALLASLGLQDRNVRVDFQPVVDWGGNGASADSFGHSDFAALEIEWILMAEKAGFKFGRYLPKRVTQPCMVVLPDGEVYDADGNIYPCYEFAYTESSSGPEYKIGHIETIDHFRNDAAITRQWNTQIEGDVSPCKRCNLFPVCGGACPKKWLHGERACPPFKDNIKDRLAMHFLKKNAIAASASAKLEPAA